MSIEASPPFALHGRRVVLRDWNSTDEISARRWVAYDDPFSEVWNIPRAGSTSFAGGLFWGGTATGVANARLSMRRHWAIETTAGTLIGRISLREINARRSQSRLGISVHAHHVSQGLGTEALTLFLQYFFNELRFETMLLDVAAVNVRAVRCYRRLGFRVIAQEWRRGRLRSTPEQHVEHATRHGYVRHERDDYWKILFFEMELHAHEWANRSPDSEHTLRIIPRRAPESES